MMIGNWLERIFQNQDGSVRSVQVIDPTNGQFVNLSRAGAEFLKGWLDILEDLTD